MHKTYITIIIILILTIVIILLWKNRSENETLLIHDTTVVTRYEKELKKDTVVKWIEKIIYKLSNPDKILVQKTDTVFIKKLDTYDLMFRVKKENDKLIINALGLNDSLIKEFIYTGIGSDFTATSVSKNIIIKSKRLKSEVLNFLLNVKKGFKSSEDYELNTGIETGIDYLDRIKITAGSEYTLPAGYFKLTAGIKFKVF